MVHIQLFQEYHIYKYAKINIPKPIINMMTYSCILIHYVELLTKPMHFVSVGFHDDNTSCLSHIYLFIVYWTPNLIIPFFTHWFSFPTLLFMQMDIIFSFFSFLQASQRQSYPTKANTVSLLPFFSENVLVSITHPTTVVPAHIHTQPQPPPSLANGIFSLWSELQQCLQCNEICEEEPLGMPVMRQQVPVLSEKHTFAFIDCIMACMKMVSH